MWSIADPDSQSDAARNVPIKPGGGGTSAWTRLSRLIWKHLFLLAGTISISVALIHVEMTTRFFFTFNAPRQRGHPHLTLIRPTTGNDTEAVWRNFGPHPGTSRDPDRETILIDLRHGLLIYYKTEPVLMGALPWPFTRVLRNQDGLSRAFGPGGSHTYNLALVGETDRLIPWGALVLADGGRVQYSATLSGYFDTDVGGYFGDSTLRWTGQDWRIRRDDDVELVFPGGRGTRLEQSAFIGVQSSNEKAEIVIDRGPQGNILRLVVGDRWLDFEHDAAYRVTAISEGNTGRRLLFDYNSAGCLIRRTGPGGVFEYEYSVHDGSCQLRGSKHDGVTYFKADYDDDDRVVRLTDPTGGAYVFSYEVDGSGKAVGASVREPDGTLRRVTIDKTGYWFSHWGSYRSQ